MLMFCDYYKIRFGIEQEYTLLQPNVKWPLGWPVGAYPGPQVNLVSPLNNSVALLMFLKLIGINKFNGVTKVI